MPNPFPGMDPYLEGDLWTSVHTDLCAEIARQLAPKVRPKYVALTSRRANAIEPVPHVSVEIRDRVDRRLVTCIEVLSSADKTGPGRDQYRGKRDQILSRAANLVEIDLLRTGTRITAPAPLSPAHY